MSRKPFIMHVAQGDESHHTGEDERLQAFYAERYARLGLAQYGVTFADYLDEPANWEAVLGPTGPAKLKAMLAHAQALSGQPTPLEEAMRMANRAAYLNGRALAAARYEGRIAELEHCVRLFRFVKNVDAAIVLEARLGLARHYDRPFPKVESDGNPTPPKAA